MPKDLEIREDIGWKKSFGWGVGSWIGMFAATKAFESITSSASSILSASYKMAYTKEIPQGMLIKKMVNRPICNYVGISSSFIYNLAINHPYISTIVVSGVVGCIAWKKWEGLSEITSQAIEKLKLGAKYTGNILKYNKRELAVTLGLAGATYIHIGSNLATFIFSTIGAAYIAGDNKDNQKALTATNRYIKNISENAIESSAVQEQLTEKDVEIQRLRTENDKLARRKAAAETDKEQAKKELKHYMENIFYPLAEQARELRVKVAMYEGGAPAGGLTQQASLIQQAIMQMTAAERASLGALNKTAQGQLIDRLVDPTKFTTIEQILDEIRKAI